MIVECGRKASQTTHSLLVIPDHLKKLFRKERKKMHTIMEDSEEAGVDIWMRGNSKTAGRS